MTSPVDDDADESRSARLRSRIYDEYVSELVLWSLFLFALTNWALMAGFLAAAAYEGAKALLIFFGYLPVPEGFASTDKAAMELGLKSIELILLAPLGYVFVSALANFIVALVEGGDSWSQAFRAVIGVKALATSLLISIVAADFVGKILEEKALDLVSSLIEAMVFISLVGYLLVLERSQNAGTAEHRR